ncbi:MAG: 6-bladed beta-propeller [Planctomycetota bacterium]
MLTVRGARLYLKHSIIRLSLAGALGLTVVICTGCGQRRGPLFVPPEPPLVWPKPPEQARIRYVGAIATEADLKPEVSWTQGLGELIFGKKETGVLVGPYAVAVDDNDRLFVADPAAQSVHILDLVTREYKQFTKLAQQQELRRPVGVVESEGKVYVVDSLLHKVCVFDRDGDFLSAFGADRLKRPSGIAYWAAEQRIYVADTAQHVVYLFDRDGNSVGQIGSRGLEAGSFNFPTHLWIDSAGQLYVSDTLNYRIQVFTCEGKFIRMFGQQGDRPGNFAHPCGVASDSFGHIYVTDRQFENIQVFDNRGGILMAMGEEGTGLGQFWLPGGICIDKRNRIYVADSFNKRVQVFELLEDGGS